MVFGAMRGAGAVLGGVLWVWVGLVAGKVGYGCD